MEALLINVLTPKSKVLCINSGKFGERWGQMARTFGGDVTNLDVTWGEAVDLEQFENMIKKENFKIVMTQACETSTGVLHPIKEMSQLLRKHSSQSLFLVDAITALGATPLPMDEWDLDGVVGGSQKAFMLPTGMSFLSFSERAWNVIRSNTTPRFYFDIRKELTANESGQTYFSSNVTLIRALNIAMDLILEKGLLHHFATIDMIARFTRRAAFAMGLESFSQSPSPSISALKTPVDSQKLRDLLEDKYQLIVMGGQDQAKGKILRIGHMGYFTKSDILESWERLKNALRDLNHQIKNPQELENIKTEFLKLEEFYS
jgi:aspartate aminotransferase-like enzyme